MFIKLSYLRNAIAHTKRPEMGFTINYFYHESTAASCLLVGVYPTQASDQKENWKHEKQSCILMLETLSES